MPLTCCFNKHQVTSSIGKVSLIIPSPMTSSHHHSFHREIPMNIFTIEVDILSFCREKPGNVSNDLGDHAPKKFSICMSSGVTTRRPYDWIPTQKKHPQHWPLKKQVFFHGVKYFSQGRKVKFHPSYPAVILRPFFWGGPHGFTDPEQSWRVVWTLGNQKGSRRLPKHLLFAAGS